MPLLILIKDYKLDPHDADAYFKRGYAKHNLEQNEAAIADFNQALHLNSDLFAAYFLRGIVKFLPCAI